MAGIKITLKETGQQSIARLWVYKPEPEEKKEPNYLIHFRRPDNYKGEFGFDWMRDEYKNICYNYNELKQEYTPCQIQGQEYFVPWLSMFPNQENVKIALNLENIKGELSRKDIIKIPPIVGVSFEPSIIKLKDIQKKREEGKEYLVTVSCSKPLTKDICISVFDKDNQVIGKLNIAKNDVKYYLPITIVNILGNNLQTDDISVSNIKSFFNQRSFQQAFIETDIRKDNLTINVNSLLEEGALSITIDENNIENIVANEKTLNFLSNLFSNSKGVNLFILKLNRWHFRKYESNNQNYNNYDVYEVIDIDNKNGKLLKGYKYVCSYNEREIDNSRGNYFIVLRGMVGESKVIPTKRNSCIVYNGYDNEIAMVHEISHLLGLPENFSTALNKNYYDKLKKIENLNTEQKEYVRDYENMSKNNYFFFRRAYTDNFMDYYEPIYYPESPIKKSFYHWQYGIMQYEINNYIEK